MKLLLTRWAFFLFSLDLLSASPASDTNFQDALEINQRYNAASIGGDTGALEEFFHRDYVHTDFDGNVRDRAGQSAFVKARGKTLESARSEDVNVNAYGNVAVITECLVAAPASEGKRSVLTQRATMVWAKEAGRWRLVAEQRSAWIPRAPAVFAFSDTTRTSPPVSTPAPFQKVRPLMTFFSETPATAGGARPADSASPARQVSAAPVAASPATADTESRQRSGLLPARVRQLIRAYEPNQVGYTFDQGDDSFLDFTFSLMLPLVGSGYPTAYRTTTGDGPLRDLRYGSPGLYFAHTQRAGQYLATRSSSPVIGKRFNPLLSLRFWAVGANGEKESEDNFVEVIYGHESNGQFISSEASFNQQFDVYFNESTQIADVDASGEALRSARDNISRGWDYLGAQFARDWDANWVLPWSKADSSTLSLRGKFSYYLKRGLAQGPVEQYNAWERDPEGQARKYVDGLSLRLAMTIAPKTPDPKRFGLERRYALTWTTGYADPLRYNTVKFEAGVMAFGLPLMLWYRTGYNSDLIDYYRKDRSYGATLSFWKF